ncbi:MAG: hypothetical protein ISS17_09465 [Bacteroidales bacterium]|nr:hypothetical protein [Bacteroidales bacterium]
MIGPHWLLTRSQPIAIRDVLYCLEKVLFKEECFDRNYDIGGPDVMTYKEILFPRLSSVWLFLFTPASFPLANHLVSSMRVEVVARNDRLHRILGGRPLTFYEAVEEASR